MNGSHGFNLFGSGVRVTSQVSVSAENTRRPLRGLILLAGVLACLGSPALALDDTLDRGVLQFKTRFSTWGADEYLDRDKISIPLSGLSDYDDFTENRLDLDFAFGWGNGLTLVWNTSYVEREIEGPAGSIKTSGIDGVYAGVRQRLSGNLDGTRFMAETGIWYPAEADQNDPLPIEYEGLSWIFIMSYNQTFYPTQGGFEMDFGYRFRNEDPEDEYFFDTSLNLQVMKIGYLKLHYHMVESRKNSGSAFDVLEYATDRGRQTVGLDLFTDLGRRWRIDIGYQTTVNGRNVFDGDGAKLSLTWTR